MFLVYLQNVTIWSWCVCKTYILKLDNWEKTRKNTKLVLSRKWKYTSMGMHSVIAHSVTEIWIRDTALGFLFTSSRPWESPDLTLTNCTVIDALIIHVPIMQVKVKALTLEQGQIQNDKEETKIELMVYNYCTLIDSG